MPANEWVSSGARAVMAVDPSSDGAPLDELRSGELAGEGAHLGGVRRLAERMDRPERLSPAGRAWEWAARPVWALLLAVAGAALFGWPMLFRSPEDLVTPGMKALVAVLSGGSALRSGSWR